MAQNYSFDIVSKINMEEVLNAVNQATREMSQRFDFKGSKSTITLNRKDRLSEGRQVLRQVLIKSVR